MLYKSGRLHHHTSASFFMGRLSLFSVGDLVTGVSAVKCGGLMRRRTVIVLQLLFTGWFTSTWGFQLHSATPQLSAINCFSNIWNWLADFFFHFCKNLSLNGWTSDTSWPGIRFWSSLGTLHTALPGHLVDVAVDPSYSYTNVLCFSSLAGLASKVLVILSKSTKGLFLFSFVTLHVTDLGEDGGHHIGLSLNLFDVYAIFCHSQLKSLQAWKSTRYGVLSTCFVDAYGLFRWQPFIQGPVVELLQWPAISR